MYILLQWLFTLIAENQPPNGKLVTLLIHLHALTSACQAPIKCGFGSQRKDTNIFGSQCVIQNFVQNEQKCRKLTSRNKKALFGSQKPWLFGSQGPWAAPMALVGSKRRSRASTLLVPGACNRACHAQCNTQRSQTCMWHVLMFCHHYISCNV